MSNPLSTITVLAGVAPASQSAADHDSTAIDFSETYLPDVSVTLVCGVLGAGATALAKIVECDTSGGSYTDVATTHVAVKAIDDNTVWTATGRISKRYVKVRVTVTTAASIAGATLTARKRVVSL